MHSLHAVIFPGRPVLPILLERKDATNPDAEFIMDIITKLHKRGTIYHFLSIPNNFRCLIMKTKLCYHRCFLKYANKKSGPLKNRYGFL